MYYIVKEKLNEEADKLAQSLKSIKPFETWRIKVDDVFIMTSSGKTVWKRINHAKSALRLHFEAVKYKAEKEHGWREIAKVYEEEYQQFLNERVKFVRID